MLLTGIKGTRVPEPLSERPESTTRSDTEPTRRTRRTTCSEQEDEEGQDLELVKSLYQMSPLPG